MTRTVEFTKGHGTENDFVLVPDHDGTVGLSARDAELLADRRAGIGGDGVIRVVRTQAADDDAVRALAGEATWFMDYRNADGSIAEMCGNGTRVFAAYLRREGLETADEFAVQPGLDRVRPPQVVQMGIGPDDRRGDPAPVPVGVGFAGSSSLPLAPLPPVPPSAAS